ncbi:MAG TPA: hypothetical protein VMJ10_37480 [Kofleriaceae bacterium]|nr:hypothetical protein [Kofleriaceae bacterium]
MRASGFGLWALAGVLICASTAHAGDPLRDYRTVESEHFIVYYWAPLDDAAHHVAVAAEKAHRTLAVALDHVPTEKTLIFLSDDTDDANGFAGVLPRNAIQLYATGPTGFSELDDFDDWLYGLIAHEYTHIVHLDTMEGLPTIYNHIFGKTWAPNQIMPRWVIEGIAVYEESKRSAGGRNRGSFFDQYIRIARKAHVDLRLDEVSGSPRQFPQSNAVYVYGSHFLQYVFDRFGDDTLRAMAHTSGAFAPPFAINRQIAKVVGRPFTELYDDWRDYLRDKYGMQEMAAERRGLVLGRAITHTAESNLLPRYSADGKWLYWLEYTGYDLTRVRAIPVGRDDNCVNQLKHRAKCGPNPGIRDIAQIDAMGPFDLEPDGSFVYEQGRVFRRDYTFEDLFRFDARTGHTTRLTTGRRARDPAISPDGRRLAFSLNQHSESALAVMDLEPDAKESIVWQGERYDEAYQPAWSPDGTRLAFSAWRTGGYRDILVVELASGKVTELMRDRAIDMDPSWSPDGRYIYFDSDRTGIRNLFAYDTRDRSVWQLTNVIGGAFVPRPSPDGKRLAFEAAVPAGGYDLYELPVDRSAWLPAREYIDDKPPPVEIHDDEAWVSAPRPYRALETLAPQSWTGTLDLASSSASVTTGGSDAVGLHSYSLAVSTDTSNANTDIGASYAYSGGRPSFSVGGARTLLERGGLKIDGVPNLYTEEDWAGTIALGIPLESRPSQSWSLQFDYDVDWYRLVGAPPIALDPEQREPVLPITNYVEAGLGARVAFSSVRSTTFALGPTTGFDAAVSLRLDHPDFGSTYKFITASYAGDIYQTLGSVARVLTVRVGGAIRAGDLVRSDGYVLGGVPPQDVAMAIINSTRYSQSGYLRGYPVRSVTGNQYHLANIEYRQEIWNIEHGLGTLPIYLRRLHVAALSDVGTAFDSAFDPATDVRWSVGGALRLDAYFGYFVPGTFEIGYSQGLIEGGIGEAWFLLTGSL